VVVVVVAVGSLCVLCGLAWLTATYVGMRSSNSNPD
jgi:hypothetical protein